MERARTTGMYTVKEKISKALFAKVTIFSTNVLSRKIRSRQRPKSVQVSINNYQCPKFALAQEIWSIQV